MDKYFRRVVFTGPSMLCPVCGGTGRELWKHYVDGKYVEEKVKCEACSGSGMLRDDNESEEYMHDSVTDGNF